MTEKTPKPANSSAPKTKAKRPAADPAPEAQAEPQPQRESDEAFRLRINAMADSIYAMMVASGIKHGGLAGAIGILCARTLTDENGINRFIQTARDVAVDVRRQDAAQRNRMQQIAEAAKQTLEEHRKPS